MHAEIDRGRVPADARSPFLRGRLFGFPALHAGNTALNMGFTLLQLLVLAHILALDRYSEIVFLATIGFYVQPLNQACGKTAFVALRPDAVRGRAARPRVELATSLACQGVVILVLALAVPSVLATPGTRVWAEDAMFLFLSLAVNAWAFDLQSTAWAVGLNLPFVRLSIVHRGLHLAALGAGFATNQLIVFVVPASVATVACGTVALRMFARAGLLGMGSAPKDWRGYGVVFRAALLSTAADFLMLNAPYVLLTTRFGIGPMLIVFDSVMKVARITMAGSRTLGEIALPRHSAMTESGRTAEARRLFWMVFALCVGASAVPALAIAIAGQTVFHLLLGANDVVAPSAMVPAALVIVASGLYQSTSFFLGYGNARQASLVVAATATGALATFFCSLYLIAPVPSVVLSAFGLAMLCVGLVAAALMDQSFRRRTRFATAPAAELISG